VMARFLTSSLLWMSCVAVMGCSQLPGKPKPGPEVPRPDEVVDFPTLYSENCSGCHGDRGMNGSAYPLANPVYQAMVNPQGLRNIVANGLPGTMMPAFASSAGGSLTDQQIDSLVNGMRSTWNKTGTLDGAHAPPYQAEKQADTAHGEEVYTTYCASCHGPATGSGKSKSKAGSIVDPSFLTLVSDQALRTVVIAGRPDIGQPDWRNDVAGHPMSDQEVTDVVGWLSSLRPRKSGGGSQ
jgi:cytochrome c oxidase cbb3-type subunit III